MNFLGIGPGEIFLILILLLVVIGPERLPEFARQAGRFVIRIRDWIARSPDAQMVLRAREEIEEELKEIRRSLTEEVETVRKELESVRGDLAEAARMVEESADAVAKTQIDFEARADDALEDAAQTIALPAQPAVPNQQSAVGDPPSAAETAAEVVEIAPQPAAGGQQSSAEAAAETAQIAPRSSVPGPPSSDVNGQPVPRSFKPGQAPPARDEDAAVEELRLRIETLGAEFSRQLGALTAELETLHERQASRAAPPIAHIAIPAPPDAEPAAAVETAAAAAPELPAPPGARRRCKGVTRAGEPCGAAPLKGQDYCRAHAARPVLEEVA
jgi:sec-independent protein translocase protein TatB